MTRAVLAVTLAGGLILTGCNRRADPDNVPIGSNVQVTRQNGALVEGKLSSRDATNVNLDVGPVNRAIARTDIADIRVADASAPAAAPRGASFRELAIPDATIINVRLDASVSSASNHEGDRIQGELADAVTAQGIEALPAGSRIEGIVTDAQPSGKVSGRARLAMRFDRVTAGGKTYDIDARVSHIAAPNTGRDAKEIGIPAAGGAVLGAIVGGGKGAAIGAAVGGGAGTAVVMSTPGDEITFSHGATIRAQLSREVDVRVPLK